METSLLEGPAYPLDATASTGQRRHMFVEDHEALHELCDGYSKMPLSGRLHIDLASARRSGSETPFSLIIRITVYPMAAAWI